ncbi:hypothetical protein [Shewanella algae]|uniref:hypothetical protein n=1 Tax=Shewanella algae TaxID=38313 RepID=UPI0031F4906D
MELVNRYQALTSQQLAYLLSMRHETMQHYLSLYRESGYFTVETCLKPYIYRLSSKGARIIGARPHVSTSVRAYQHLCHRNQALFSLRGLFPDSEIRLLPKKAFYRFGLQPAPIYEHPIAINDRFGLMLVDDGGSSISRIKSAWFRDHKPHSSFDPSPLIAAGKPIISRWTTLNPELFLFSSRSRKKIDQALKRYSVPAKVFPLELLWELGE